jgi:SPP1 gp7 family putative phage head morphogenesis protein
MTVHHNLSIISEARRIADELLADRHRVPLRKAMDLKTPASFDLAVARMAIALRQQTDASDRDAVRAAVAVLDVDWRATSAEKRSRLVEQALVEAGRRTAAVPRAIETVLADNANDVVSSTRDDLRHRQGLTIAANFNALDRRIVHHLVSSEANFVRDEYGRRQAALGLRAREVVAAGLEAGLGREDITRDVARVAASTLSTRSPFYWEVVAGSFIGRGRSYAQLSAFAEAGIERYRIEAVLDERTTPVCRFLHGKVFSVGSGLRTFERVEANPSALKDITPWVREQRNPRTGRRELYVNRAGEHLPVAEVVRSGLGAKDDEGEFRATRGDRELADLGLSFPPWHGLCRSSVTGIV